MPIRKPPEELKSDKQQSCSEYYKAISDCMIDYTYARLRKHYNQGDSKTNALQRLARRFHAIACDQDWSDPVRQTKLDLVEYTFAYIAALSQHKHRMHRFDFFKPQNPAPGLKQYRQKVIQKTQTLPKDIQVPKDLAFTDAMSRDIEQQLEQQLRKLDSLQEEEANDLSHSCYASDKVQIHAVDADDCFLLSSFDSKKANHNLINHINQSAEDAKQTLVISFSSRIRYSEDDERSLSLNTNHFLDNPRYDGLGELSKAFRDYPAISVDTKFLLSDIDTKRRRSFNYLRDTTTHIDEKKLMRTYQIAHHFANRAKKGTSVTINLYDDRQDILDTVLRFYGNNPQLLPSNITIKAHCYQLDEADFQTLPVSGIEVQGQGSVNPDYNRILAGICDKVAENTNQLGLGIIKQLGVGRINYYFEQVQKQLTKFSQSEAQLGRRLPIEADKLYHQYASNEQPSQTLDEQCLYLHYLGMTSQLLDEVTQSANFEEVFEHDLQHIVDNQAPDASSTPCAAAARA